jgi:hypothetical protein
VSLYWQGRTGEFVLGWRVGTSEYVLDGKDVLVSSVLASSYWDGEFVLGWRVGTDGEYILAASWYRGCVCLVDAVHNAVPSCL